AMDPHRVGLLASSLALPYEFMKPVLGGLADAGGKTRLMTLSLAALVISAGIGAFAQDFSTLLLSRVMSGIVAGGVFPISVAIAGDLGRGGKRQGGDRARAA